MRTLDAIEWTDEEIDAICRIGDWYGNILDARRHEVPGHALRAVLAVALETYVSTRQGEELAKAGADAQLDPDTVARLTAEPATADELAAVCGVLASTLGVNSGIVNEGDLRQHRDVMVANVLAQVRLRNQTEHMGGSYLQ